MSTPTTMPPVGAVFQRSAGDARIDWLPDGYPGRIDPGDNHDAVPHPMFGAYALSDYIDQYRRRPSTAPAAAIRSVVRASLGRMDSHRGALVFWYEETDSTSRSTVRHYSGLTQGYYAINLARAGRALEDREISDAADRVFAALTIPASAGGVYTEGRLGPSIAQVTQEPSSYILNGWQSSIASILEFAEVSEREDARQLAHSSAREMARLLPLYDAPDLRNSRYGLTGFVYVRLVFRGPHEADAAVRDAAVVIPGGSEHPIDQLGGRRFHNHVIEKDVERSDERGHHVADRVLRLNVVLSRISFPVPNRLRCTVTGHGGTVDVQVHRGRYDPLSSAPIDREWVTVARYECAAGESTLDVPLPWDVADLVAYPTNFAKRIGGLQTNVYHLTHIRRLRELAEQTGIGDLREWADTWTRYISEWKSMPIYEGLHVRWGRSTLPVGEAHRALPVAAAPSVRD